MSDEYTDSDLQKRLEWVHTQLEKREFNYAGELNALTALTAARAEIARKDEEIADLEHYKRLVQDANNSDAQHDNALRKAISTQPFYLGQSLKGAAADYIGKLERERDALKAKLERKAQLLVWLLFWSDDIYEQENVHDEEFVSLVELGKQVYSESKMVKGFSAAAKDAKFAQVNAILGLAKPQPAQEEKA